LFCVQEQVLPRLPQRVMVNWESPENIHDFAEDQHGLLYVLSDQALHNLYGNNLSVLADSSLKMDAMQGILPQSKDKLSLIPSDGFPLQYDLQNDEILMLANNKRLLAIPSYVLYSANKTIWLGSLQQGLLRFKNGQIKKIVFPDAALSKNFGSVSGLNMDAQGALWLLSQNGHIAVFDKDMGLKHFFHIRDAFSKYATFWPRILKLNRNNMSILPNSSNIINVLTEDYSQERLKIMEVDSLEVLEMKNITDVAVDEEQDLWIGSRENGLWK
jgi:ligand-binding sensor domain-containing protein